MKTRAVICSSCNEKFGSAIDKSISDVVSHFRNMLNLPSGNGDAPPVIRGVETSEGKIDLLPGGRPSINMRPFQIDRNDENTTLSVSCKPEQLGVIIDNVSKKLGVDRNKLIDKILEDGADELVRPITSVIHRNVAFGEIAHQRSMAKMCLVLWAKVCGNDEVRSEKYSKIRRFITGSDGNGSLIDVELDARPYPLKNLDKYGDFANSIIVMSNESGKAYGYFKLMNGLAWRFTLCNVGAQPNRYEFIFSNPEHPSRWDTSESTGNKIFIPWKWLESTSCEDIDKFSTAWMESLLRRHVDDSRSSFIERTIKETLDELGVREGDLIPQEFVNIVSTKVAHYFVGLPLKRKIPRNKLEQYFVNG